MDERGTEEQDWESTCYQEGGDRIEALEEATKEVLSGRFEGREQALQAVKELLAIQEAMDVREARKNVRPSSSGDGVHGSLNLEEKPVDYYS